MQLREAVMDFQDQNLSLRARVSELEQEINRAKSIYFDGKVYWVTVAGGGRQGPFCQKCYDKDNKICRLQQGANNSVAWFCSVCNFMAYH